MKWRAFVVWIALLFLSAIVVPKLIFRFYGRGEISPIYSLGIMSCFLAICTALAAIGTIAVWVLPVRRVWLGITGGVIAGAGSVALAAWLAMTFYRGFEISIWFFWYAAFLAPGSCLAGAYAGFLRSRQNNAPRLKSES
jgi:MFS family permease